jgi:hypothetical protein
MAGAVEDLELGLAQGHPVAVVQPAVGQGGCQRYCPQVRTKKKQTKVSIEEWLGQQTD